MLMPGNFSPAALRSLSLVSGRVKKGKQRSKMPASAAFLIQRSLRAVLTFSLFSQGDKPRRPAARPITPEFPMRDSLGTQKINETDYVVLQVIQGLSSRPVYY